MMVGLTLTLGRIFDTDGDSASINNLIKNCINDVEVFSKENLRIRKLKQSGFSVEWIDSYIDKPYEPRAKDFHMLKSKIAKYRRIYEDYHHPIRNKIFAHVDKEYVGRKSELWEAAKSANMVEMLNFLEDLKVTLQMTYDNGRQPELGGHEFDEEWFSKDILALFERVKNA